MMTIDFRPSFREIRRRVDERMTYPVGSDAVFIQRVLKQKSRLSNRLRMRLDRRARARAMASREKSEAAKLDAFFGRAAKAGQITMLEYR